MRGGFLHNEVLLAPLAALVRAAGVECFAEFQIRDGRNSGFIDLYFEGNGRRVAVEAETRSERERNDVFKALQVNATHLLIVTPDSRTAAAIRRRLDREFPASESIDLCIEVFPFSAAKQRISEFLTKKVSPVSHADNKTRDIK